MLRVPYYVRAAALGLPAYFMAVYVWVWILVLPSSFQKMDFRQFYAGAYMVRTGKAHELYDYAQQKKVEDAVVSKEQAENELPFVSPPYHAWLLSPLTIVSYPRAFVIFMAFNFCLIGACIAMLWPWMRNLGLIYPWLPFALCFSFYPIGFALTWGQDSILLTTLLIGCFVLLTKQRDLLAGMLIAIALFKFQIVLPVVFLFLLWRRWHFIAGFGAVTAILISCSIWIAGIRQNVFYLQSILSIANLNQPGGLAAFPVKWNTMPNLAGLSWGLLHSFVPNIWIKGVTAVLSIAAIVVTFRVGRTGTDGALLLLMAIPCAVLTGYHTYMHDLSPLLLPMLVLLDSCLPSEAAGHSRQRLAFRLAALMFVAPILNSFIYERAYIVVLAVVGLLFSVTLAHQRMAPIVKVSDAAACLTSSPVGIQP